MFLKTKSYIITKEGKIIWLKSKSKRRRRTVKEEVSK